jgi:hypothetical protein
MLDITEVYRVEVSRDRCTCVCKSARIARLLRVVVRDGSGDAQPDRSPHMHHRSLRIVLPLIACLATMLPSAAVAAPGDYTVRLTTTSGSFWSTYGRGPFIATAQRVYSGIGIFETGDYKSWRAVVPGEGARIVGGHITVTMSTPGATMQGRILVGSGNSPVVLYDGGADGAVERAVSSGAHDWMQFDLRSTGHATTSRIAENYVNFGSADLVLRDTVPPVLEPLSLPPATQWYGAGACIPFSIRLTDQGGGLLRSQVRRASDGVVVSELGTTQQQNLKPGPTEQHLEDCIQPSERGHGDTLFIATAWDVGGTARELAFSVRADHRAPTIGGGPADGTRFTVAQPELAFEVGDEGAGIAATSATIDGAPVEVATSGTSARLVVAPLSIGAHTVAIAVTDGAGNATRVERRISVADVAAPSLTVDSPGDRGEATAFLSVRAGDDMSGVDAATWLASVNGETVATSTDAEHLTATLGPLAPGRQRIDVRVADHAGNVATVTRTYEVASAAVPSMPDIGARTGAFLVDAPRSAVAYGARVTTAVFVARNGRPMSGQTVEVRRNGTAFGSATTDADGIAHVSFRAGAPGTWQAWVVGLQLEPADVPLRIAPRLIVRAARLRPRAGQRVLLTGRIVPAIRGRRLAVEARIGGAWYPIRRVASTAADGSFRTSVVATTPGRVWVRVRILTVGAWAPAVSNQQALRVTARPHRVHGHR